MLPEERLVQIHALLRQGLSIRKIAREFGVSRNAVHYYLRNLVIKPKHQNTKTGLPDNRF